jgi:hypothetical protein
MEGSRDMALGSTIESGEERRVRECGRGRGSGSGKEEETATYQVDAVRLSVARYLEEDDDLVVLLGRRGVTVPYRRRFNDHKRRGLGNRTRDAETTRYQYI